VRTQRESRYRPTPNAYWDEEYREVTLCFESMTALLKIADQPPVAAAVERFRARQ
jgi:hypothetical protein